MEAASRSSQSPRQPSRILFISAGFWHPSLLARWAAALALRGSPAFHFQFASSLEVLPHLDLKSIQALILYFHQRAISAAAMTAFEAYVSGGGGVLALHSAAASFKTQPGYSEILGGQFERHGPLTRFEVIPAALPGGLCVDLPRFWVRDELYRHAFDPAVSVHLYTEVEARREPVMWTHLYGEGRVCYCSLGHTASALRCPQVRLALQRGLSWAVGIDQAEEAAG